MVPETGTVFNCLIINVFMKMGSLLNRGISPQFVECCYGNILSVITNIGYIAIATNIKAGACGYVKFALRGVFNPFAFQ